MTATDFGGWFVVPKVEGGVRKQSRRNSLTNQIILAVDDEHGFEHSYPIQKYKLESSEFLTTLLEGQCFTEYANTIKIEEVNIDVFEQYFHWLGMRSFENNPELVIVMQNKKKFAHPQHFVIELYALGQRMQDKQFQSAVMDDIAMDRALSRTWDTDSIHQAYNTLSRGSNLIRWLVEQEFKLLDDGFEDDNYNDLPREYLEDMCLWLSKDKKERKQCCYRDHGQEASYW